MSPSDLGESLDFDDARFSCEMLSSTFKSSVLLRSRLRSALSYLAAADLKRCELLVSRLMSFSCEVLELLLLLARISCSYLGALLSCSLTTGTGLAADSSVWISWSVSGGWILLTSVSLHREFSSSDWLRNGSPCSLLPPFDLLDEVLIGFFGIVLLPLRALFDLCYVGFSKSSSFFFSSFFEAGFDFFTIFEPVSFALFSLFLPALARSVSVDGSTNYLELRSCVLYC